MPVFGYIQCDSAGNKYYVWFGGAHSGDVHYIPLSPGWTYIAIPQTAIQA